jgi:signal transduction histidine kinase
MAAHDAPQAFDSSDRPGLERAFLFKLALVVAVALNLVLLAAAALAVLAPPPLLGFSVLFVLVTADIVLLVLFGRHLIRGLVLRPMQALTAAADELAAGNLSHRAQPAETREFTHLAERFNRMTERLEDARDQLVRAEKLASVGYLAAGIAHEVGNPLSAIGTYIEVLERRGADPEILAALNRETDRIDRIVRGLLAYARPHGEVVTDLDVGQVARNVMRLLTEQGALKRMDVRMELDDHLPRVRGKAHALEQVLVNLVLNAVDAAAGGRIVLGGSAQRYRTRPQDEARAGDAQAFVGPKLELGRRPWRPEVEDGTTGVLVWVADSGPGVPESERSRIFDAFMTTKDPGHGTGLGLAIVQSTVEELGGTVWVDEAREGGAAFKIFLPEGA